MTSEYHDLWQRQRELQLEAATVSGDLQLDDLLARLGEPVPVGSVALGLMVWRDLDITVVCPSLDVAAAIGAAAHFATHARVWQVQFRNDTGLLNTDPAYPDGLYSACGTERPITTIGRLTSGSSTSRNVSLTSLTWTRFPTAHSRRARSDPEDQRGLVRSPRVRQHRQQSRYLYRGTRTRREYSQAVRRLAETVCKPSRFHREKRLNNRSYGRLSRCEGQVKCRRYTVLNPRRS